MNVPATRKGELMQELAYNRQRDGATSRQSWFSLMRRLPGRALDWAGHQLYLFNLWLDEVGQKAFLAMASLGIAAIFAIIVVHFAVRL